MTETEIIVKQKQILADAIKTIGTNKRTPTWIVDLCKRAVMSAREVEGDKLATKTSVQQNTAPFEPGDIVRAIDSTDKNVYSIVRLSTTIQGVNLWDLSVIKSDGKAPVGGIAHNVPETKFRK